jgi:hypothetical protein|tara:strand:- start:185 stop:388 length:204 start_codon:yes stop_codon:yes gene_type:complete
MKHFNVGDLVVLAFPLVGSRADQGIVLCHNWQERKVEIYLIGEGKTRMLHDSRVRVLSKNTDGGTID